MSSPRYSPCDFLSSLPSSSPWRPISPCFVFNNPNRRNVRAHCNNRRNQSVSPNYRQTNYHQPGHERNRDRFRNHGRNRRGGRFANYRRPETATGVFNLPEFHRRGPQADQGINVAITDVRNNGANNRDDESADDRFTMRSYTSAELRFAVNFVK